MDLKITKTSVYLDNEEIINNYSVVEEEDNITIMDDKTVIVFKNIKSLYEWQNGEITNDSSCGMKNGVCVKFEPTKMSIIFNDTEHEIINLNVYNNELYVMF